MPIGVPIVVVLQLRNLLFVSLKLHAQLLVLLGKSLIDTLQLLDLFVTLLMTLLHSHYLLHHLWCSLGFRGSLQEGLFIPRIQPLVVTLCGLRRTQK